MTSVVPSNARRAAWCWFLFALSLFALAPAFFFNPHPSDQPPPYAFPHYAADTVDVKIMPSAIDRVLVLINRHYRLNETRLYARLMIWLPLAVGVFSIRMFYQTHPNVNRRALLIVVAAAVVAVLVPMLWTWEWLSLMLVGASVMVVVLTLRHARELAPPVETEQSEWRSPNPEVRAHLLVVAALLFCAAVLSSSTHVCSSTTQVTRRARTNSPTSQPNSTSSSTSRRPPTSAMTPHGEWLRYRP